MSKKMDGKVMKNVKTGILILLCMLVLVGCASNKPQAVVNKLLSSIKDFDAEAISDCLVPDSSADIYDGLIDFQSDTGEWSADVLSYIKDNAQKITYEIVDSQVSGDNANVEVKINYVNAYPIFKATGEDYAAKKKSETFMIIKMTREEEQQFIASTMKEKINLLGETYDEMNTTVFLEKIDGTWFVKSLSSELVDVLTSGYISTDEVRR